MSETIVAVYDTGDHAVQAINALRRAGVPQSSIHRQILDGDDLWREHPPMVVHHEPSLWSTLFGSGEAEEHLVPEDSDEAGGTVVRVTGIPAERYDAVLDILHQYHPADVIGRMPATR